MSLSTSCLIHLTETLDALTGILTDGFKISYSIERNIFRGGLKWSAAVPMVSFCDIPLSELRNHLGSYGQYGIGLTKSWAKHNGLNPILYVDTESTLGIDIRNASKEILAGKRILEKHPLQIAVVIDILRYMKNYEGKLVRRNGESVSNYRFSDEREWRYVPNHPDPKVPATILEKKYLDDNLRAKANEFWKDVRLKFAPDDIAYIIVKENTEVDLLLPIFSKLQYDTSLTTKLSSKIITSQQILQDF